MIILMLMYVLISLVMIALGLPLIARKIRPNPFYGFRVRRTLENEDLWYAVNAHFGWRMIIIGMVTIFTAVALYVIPGISPDAYALGILGIFLVSFALGLSQSWRFMNSFGRK